MFRYLARRLLLQAVPVLFVIITLTFFLQRFAPGGPFTREKALPPEIQRNLDAYYHLDDPLWRQYRDYLWDLCPKTFHPLALRNGFDLKAAFGIDLRPSFKYANRTVNEIIAAELPVSLTLGSLALLVALGFGLGPAAAGILTGSFVVETIFQIPGLGRDFVISVTNRDYTLVLGTVVVYGTFIVVCNFLADVLQAWMNPKLTLE